MWAGTPASTSDLAVARGVPDYGRGAPAYQVDTRGLVGQQQLKDAAAPVWRLGGACSARLARSRVSTGRRVASRARCAAIYGRHDMCRLQVCEPRASHAQRRVLKRRQLAKHLLLLHNCLQIIIYS